MGVVPEGSLSVVIATLLASSPARRRRGRPWEFACGVWSKTGLIEVRADSDASRPGLVVVGLPEDTARTTADRVRAALLNSGLVREVPKVAISLEPAVSARLTSDLDLAIALAALAAVGAIDQEVRWVLATGRLGLDGSVMARGLDDRLTLADVLGSLCRTRVIGFERMFERDKG